MISGIRKVIAARMTESNSIPSVTLTSKVDITNCVNYQNELLKEWRKEKIRPTFQDLIAKSVALSLVEHKIFNTHFLDNEIKQFDEINLGIAYALKDGLVVPVIKNSQSKSLLEIAKKMGADHCFNVAQLKKDNITIKDYIKKLIILVIILSIVSL